MLQPRRMREMFRSATCSLLIPAPMSYSPRTYLLNFTGAHMSAVIWHPPECTLCANQLCYTINFTSKHVNGHVGSQENENTDTHLIVIYRIVKIFLILTIVCQVQCILTLRSKFVRFFFLLENINVFIAFYAEIVKGIFCVPKFPSLS